MKKLLLIFFVVNVPLIVLSQSNWHQHVNFVIDVTLNDTEHTLDGFEKIEYLNNSPDTLLFIWFHIWPNAFKNDKTAFSEQLLINNRTDFYFSDKSQRGYINHLDFKVNGVTAQTEDHGQHIDIIKVLLPRPLLPGLSISITTPFHVQLPENFSRGGHTGDSYQITQWYPKPAVYDRKGWHPFPYLDQGEFYSEFGDYKVLVTIPKNYVVAATGELQDSDEKEWVARRSTFTWEPIRTTITKKKGRAKFLKRVVQLYPTSSKETKTLQFVQKNVHDFAWFADKRYRVYGDTLLLSSGKIVNVYSYFLPSDEKEWEKSLFFMKRSVRFRSFLMGEYPFDIISAVEARMGTEGGMEYPTITSISPMESQTQLEETLEHEIGHNWLYGILATNEREYAWMDEGMNTYYDERYQTLYHPSKHTDETNKPFLESRIPRKPERVALETMYSIKKDQPINTLPEKMTYLNYGLVTYIKTGEWMELLENRLGTAVFDSCMREYYREWQFGHPYPEDFKMVVEKVSGKNLDEIFSLLDKKGPLVIANPKKKLKPVAFFSLKDTEKYQFINFLPAIGYNSYDQFMVGALIHNYDFPVTKFQFVIAPLYATGTKTLNGIGKISYTTYRYTSAISKIEYSLSGEKFSTKISRDTFGNKEFQYFYKIVPAIRVSFREAPLSHAGTNLDFRIFFIKEKTFDGFVSKSGDSLNRYPTSYSNTDRYITQLSYTRYNKRILYPYQYQLQLQQGKGFYRFNFNGNYFFNYAKGGGLNVRAFAAAFGYIGEKTTNALLYLPKLLGVRGEEDYTYSNYFLGRSASSSNPEGPISNNGLAGQQIMIRDGGLKLVLDQYDFLQGRSEKWVAALNFNSTFPNNLIPIKVFFDVGTYAEAWQKDAPTSKFLFTGGLQLSLLKNLINIYLPLVYSKDFRDYIKYSYPQNRLLKTISFSIDIQNFSLGKINKHLEF